MKKGQRMTLADFFKLREAEMQRESETPEYKAMMERNMTRFDEEQKSLAAWEEAHPYEVSYNLGVSAAIDGADRWPPHGVPNIKAWLAGYDAETNG